MGNETGCVAARPRHTLDEAGADRVDNASKHNRDSTVRTLQRPHDGAASGQDDVRFECNHFGHILANKVWIGAHSKAVFEPDVAPFNPSQLLQRLLECRIAGCGTEIADTAHDADAPHSLGLLRARRARPRDYRAAEQRDEVAPSHSITSSARVSIVGGMLKRRSLAALTLITSSNFTGCSIGRLPGASPLKILST